MTKNKNPHVSYQALISSINRHRLKIYTILEHYQPKKVVDYEIERVIDTLTHEEKHPAIVENISVFLPTNLPFYSLILFGIIPSGMASGQLFLKPNSEMRDQKIIESLVDLLGITRYFPNITIIDLESKQFIKQFIPISDVIIFTGYAANKDKIIPMMKSNSLLIYNGNGHNPIVVSKDADLEKAASDACFTRFFNSGQDCAGPDAILIDHKVYKNFLSLYIDKVSQLKVDDYRNDETDVGPIYRKSELTKFLSLIYAVNPEHILFGGTIDVGRRLVQPTVIAGSLNEKPNFSETFGPISFVYPYHSDKELLSYFYDHDGAYRRNKMYVSIYGSNEVLSKLDDNLFHDKKGKGIGIILSNQTIHDYERGYKPYGGYCIGASGVIIKYQKNNVQSLLTPIHIPQVITQYGKPYPKKSKTTKIDLEKIQNTFTKKVQEIFSNKLVFSFIFGSVATGFNHDGSDLDTCVCLRKRDRVQEEKLQRWLVKFQLEMRLKPDFKYISEITTLEDLEKHFDQLTNKPLDLYFNSESVFDSVILMAALAQKKIAIFTSEESKKKLSDLTRQANKILKQLVEKVIQDFKEAQISSRKTFFNFPQMNVNEILDNLLIRYKQKANLLILKDFIPLGGQEIINTQDDHNFFSKNYDEKPNRPRTYSI